MLLKERYAEWSQARIAKHVGVSAMFVSRVKASMEIKDEPTTKKFVKDGVEKEMNVSNIGRKTQPAKEPEVAPYDEKEDKIRELSEVITQLDEENTLLKDKIAIGQWDASDIEKIDVEDTIAELREQVRLLEIDNKALRESRDMFQNRNAELMKTVSYLQKKLKKETA
jgi:exonuclease VII small subunit